MSSHDNACNRIEKQRQRRGEFLLPRPCLFSLSSWFFFWINLSHCITCTYLIITVSLCSTHRSIKSMKELAREWFNYQCTFLGCIPLGWSRSESEITQIIDHQRWNWWICNYSGFIGCFDAPWSEWSWISDAMVQITKNAPQRNITLANQLRIKQITWQIMMIWGHYAFLIHYIPHATEFVVVPDSLMPLIGTRTVQQLELTTLITVHEGNFITVLPPRRKLCEDIRNINWNSRRASQIPKTFEGVAEIKWIDWHRKTPTSTGQWSRRMQYKMSSDLSSPHRSSAVILILQLSSRFIVMPANRPNGATLLQRGRPIVYTNRVLSKTKRRYVQIKRKMLALVFSLETFQQYTYRSHVKIHGDHNKPLKNPF